MICLMANTPSYENYLNFIQEKEDASRRSAKWARIMGMGGAGTVAAGASLTARNEKSKLGNALLGVGALGLTATAALAAKAESQQEQKTSDTWQNLGKAVRELNKGRREGSPAVEAFADAIEDVVEENKERGQIKVLGEGSPTYYKESLEMVAADGRPLTVNQGIMYSPVDFTPFSSITVWEPSRKKGTEYSVYFGWYHGIDVRKSDWVNTPQKVGITNNREATGRDIELATQLLTNAQPLSENLNPYS